LKSREFSKAKVGASKFETGNFRKSRNSTGIEADLFSKINSNPRLNLFQVWQKFQIELFGNYIAGLIINFRNWFQAFQMPGNQPGKGETAFLENLLPTFWEPV
jgi:hypothetical protein